MRIEIYPYIAALPKLTLPGTLPGNPCFPSGDLPGLGVFCKLSVFLKKHTKNIDYLLQTGLDSHWPRSVIPGSFSK